MMLPPSRWSNVLSSYGPWEQEPTVQFRDTEWTTYRYMALSFSGVGFGWASSTTFTT